MMIQESMLSSITFIPILNIFVDLLSRCKSENHLFSSSMLTNDLFSPPKGINFFLAKLLLSVTWRKTIGILWKLGLDPLTKSWILARKKWWTCCEQRCSFLQRKGNHVNDRIKWHSLWLFLWQKENPLRCGNTQTPRTECKFVNFNVARYRVEQTKVKVRATHNKICSFLQCLFMFGAIDFVLQLQRKRSGSKACGVLAITIHFVSSFFHAKDTIFSLKFANDKLLSSCNNKGMNNRSVEIKSHSQNLLTREQKALRIRNTGASLEMQWVGERKHFVKNQRNREQGVVFVLRRQATHGPHSVYAAGLLLTKLIK